MKTERRHELETNQLADSLAHWIDRIQPYLRTIFGLLIAVVVLIFAGIFVRQHSTAKAQEGWDEYFQALSGQRNAANRLADVAEKYPRTPVAWWSTAVLADLNLNEGSDLLFKDKAVGRDKLQSAVDQYQTVLDGSTEPALLQRAAYGLARAQEALGQLDAAKKEYERLNEKWPGNPFEAAAQQRVRDLSRGSTREFYAWFGKQEPGKIMSREPGVPGMKVPFDLDSIGQPDGSNKSGPALPGDTIPGGKLFGDDKSPPESTTDDGADMLEPSEQTEPSEKAPSTEKTGPAPASTPAPAMPAAKPPAKKP